MVVVIVNIVVFHVIIVRGRSCVGRKWRAILWERGYTGMISGLRRS